MEVFTIEISKTYGYEQWRGDIKRLLIASGTEQRQFTFLISDSQIKENYILEDLNNMLNSGDVPNLIPQDEFIALIDKLRNQARQEDREDLYSFGTNIQYQDYFIEKIRAHLHVVLVLSSIGDGLRTRIRMFPSLVNCCTLVWYNPWPEEGLHAVATNFIQDLELGHSTTRGMINVCKHMHMSVQ
mmetsp:Transcript_28687/g.25686  ORF Transcript_28687/g.25686 Transcript_28687/m.25686 type:complete len:185 (-) Transcript_28687:4501-5055(-)